MSLCSIYSSLSPSHEPLATTDLLTISVVLSFPECFIVRIIQYVTFSDWLPQPEDLIWSTSQNITRNLSILLLLMPIG